LQSSTTAGYSGTPLAKKLGIKAHTRVLLFDAPKDYAQLVVPLPDDVTFETRPSPPHRYGTRFRDAAINYVQATYAIAQNAQGRSAGLGVVAEKDGKSAD
jgi:hypothetical protein